MSHPINEQIKDTINDELDNLTVSELQSMVETLGIKSEFLDDFLRHVAEQMYEQLHLKL